jgi:hypothetical protein
MVPRRTLIAGDPVEILMLFEKIGDIQERVAFQTQIHERGLHPWKHAGDAALMDAARERIFVGALKINFHQLIVFDQRYFGLMPVGRDHQFLTHPSTLSAAIRESSRAQFAR